LDTTSYTIVGSLCLIFLLFKLLHNFLDLFLSLTTLNLFLSEHLKLVPLTPFLVMVSVTNSQQQKQDGADKKVSSHDILHKRLT
jgi:hypothetical protein